jgi:hypothetical protein
MSYEPLLNTESNRTSENSRSKGKHGWIKSIAQKIKLANHKKEEEVMEHGISINDTQELHDFFNKPAQKVGENVMDEGICVDDIEILYDPFDDQAVSPVEVQERAEN